VGKADIEKLRKVLAANPRDFDDKCDRFKSCTADEYKELALFALKTLCKNGKFIQCRTDKYGWAAHHITKAVFEEQDIFDPYKDAEFRLYSQSR
jgi:hypothetical protein